MNETREQVVPDNAQLAIQARNLSKKFINEYAVQNVSFDIPRGKIFGFIGPSGCGKTTTVRLLTGIYEPTEGTVSVLGKDPRHFSSGARARIGYMPQLFVLYPDLSVWENINFAASLYGLNPFTRQKRLNELLDFVELSAHRDKLVRNTSGGMQRRLSLATALVPNPDLIFLDEPTAGIDPVLRQKFWERFKDLQNNGRTLFITTQYVGEAAYCDYVGVMANGHLLMVETPEDLRKHAFGGQIVDLQASSPISFEKVFAIQDLDFVQGKVHLTGENALRITVDDASRAIPELIEWCKRNGVPVESINEFVPPFDDVFVQLIQQEAEHE
jgi:ABC-2 type transport system ATP-binding protein